MLKSVEAWDKLTPKQLLIVASIALRPNYEKSFTTKVFLRLNGLRVKKGYTLIMTDDGHNFKSYIFQMNWKRPFTISANIFASMVKKFEWLEQDITLFHCLPKIGRYQASDYRLYNCTLEQYLFADNLYGAYASTRQRKYLRQLTAVFYHKAKESFDSSKVAGRSSRFRFTQMNRLFATYLWYTGVKKWIMNKYPYIFEGGGSGATMPPDESILNLLSNLNQGDITKNEIILKTHVHEALYQLNLFAKKSQE